MLKIVVSQDGEPDREVVVPGNSGIVGRVAPCDVLVDQPYVSKKHLMVLHGTVVVDLGSSNGTYIDGRRLRGAELIDGRSLAISQNGVQLRVEVEEEEDATVAAPAAEPEVSSGGGEVDALRAENANLKERLDSIKMDVESRVFSDGESVQAKLAMQRVENVQALNEKLQNEIDQLRAQADVAESSEGAAEALEASRREARELRAELESFKADAAESKTPDFFFKLQADNAELKRKLSEVSASSGGTPEPSSSKHVKELMEARLRITALETEISNLRVMNAPAMPVAPVQAKPAKTSSGEDSSALRRILVALSEDDVERLARPSGGPPEEFLLIESLRLLRQMERVVTRVAGDLIQLFRLQTMLPDTVGTYRDHIAVLLIEGKDDPRTRANTVEYLETLGRWLVASIGAHRKAAVLFASKLKEDLTEKGLTAKTPLPSFAKVPMVAGSELWKRSQEYLLTLSPDTIDERIDEIARDQAQKLLNENP